MTEPKITADAKSVAVVREFLDAMVAEDVERATTLLDPDIAWHNTSLPTVRGVPRVRRILEGLRRPSLGFDVVVHHIAATGDVVLTERTDVLRFGPVSVRFWVCGTFELRDGKITVWDDHYNVGTLVGAAGAGVLRAVLRRS
ncbi:limonene-1,2-epoxide hydrolase family protein [Rhodococcus rhodochrous]|uniref:Epoxide hydrolase n=1 Tax=Rhodococcus rhodochrous KG-21 TaxID=1441923 RepID=A0A0M9WN87_RHORH|nr:limonene-1,2-epoxide hydrolase family protein [Rhodococcus rhodochrous]KOS55340.1 epoxide hydrolase [Rhodococcus rhodochrous KG-21]